MSSLNMYYGKYIPITWTAKYLFQVIFFINIKIKPQVVLASDLMLNLNLTPTMPPWLFGDQLDFFQMETLFFEFG